MNNDYLPMEWYIAMLKWMKGEVETLPLCTFCTFRGRKVVRLYLDDKYKRYKQFSPRSDKYDYYANVATRRAELAKRICEYEDILAREYHVSYRSVENMYSIVPNRGSFLDMKYWNKSISNRNTQSIKTDYASDGIDYKSRFEMNVANELTDMGIDFVYEPRVFISDYRKRYADFGFYFPMFNRCVYMELLGRMNDHDYVYDNKKKLYEYLESGFYIGRDLYILSGDDNHIPGINQIRAAIICMITTICELYVKKA